MDRHKNPPAAFAVLTEGIINNTDCNIHPLNEIRNLSAEQLCDILNRRYTLALEPGIRSVSPLREGADNPTSFIVNEEGNWHDFGASDDEHVHGDIIDFIRIRENVDFGTALEIIAAELGIEASGIDSTRIVEIQRQRDCSKLMMSELELVTQYSEQQLAAHPEIMEVVLARGFTKEFVLQRRIGFLDSMGGYRRWAAEQHPDTRLKLYISYLESRILVPYFDATGSKVIYLIGRSL